MDGKGHDPMTFKRNLHFLGVPLVIHGGPTCLFFRQTGGRGCNIPSWKCDCSKSCFHTTFQV